MAGNLADMAKRKKAKADAREKADATAVESFVKGANYADGEQQHSPEPKKVDRRRKPADKKGKAVTFYLTEKNSSDLDCVLDTLPRSVKASRSDLVKICIDLLKSMSKEEIEARLMLLNQASISSAEAFLKQRLFALSPGEELGDIAELALLFASQQTQSIRYEIDRLDQEIDADRMFEEDIEDYAHAVFTKDDRPTKYKRLCAAADQQFEAAQRDLIEAAKKLKLYT